MTKLVSSITVLISPHVRHVGGFLGMTFIIEHHLLKGCYFTLNTNNLLCLNQTNILIRLFLNRLSPLLNFWLGWNVTNMMKMHKSYHMLNSQLNMFGINQIRYGQEEKPSPRHPILLNKIKGPTCYEDIRTINGTKDACYALGLLDDDREYISSINETHHWATAFFCRSVFVMLITSDSLSRSVHVFEETYKCLFDDVIHVREQEIGIRAKRGCNFQPYVVIHRERIIELWIEFEADTKHLSIKICIPN
uniref:Uncharacterized protein n=1 Tax=Lactuca sativa TaxID=4236 RepID=A0A9R1VGQ4_LACSA|nr:hypothetical protein LSAT_V11C500262960 [Lactuca sativa]